MRIRRLRPEDAQVFFDLRLEGLREFPHAFGESADEFEARGVSAALEWLTSNASPDSFILGAFDDDGDLSGVVGLHRPTGHKRRHAAIVWGMYVRGEVRGRGVGKDLMEALVSQARRVRGVEQIKLSVESGNTRAVRLYEACGFESFGIEPGALKVDGRDYAENHMLLRL